MVTVDDDRAGLWWFHAAEQREQCGFAGPGRAEVKFVEHGERAGTGGEAVAEPVHLDGGHVHTGVAGVGWPAASRRGSVAKALMPSAKSTVAANPSASAARSGDATTWRTSPKR